MGKKLMLLIFALGFISMPLKQAEAKRQTGFVFTVCQGVPWWMKSFYISLPYEDTWAAHEDCIAQGGRPKVVNYFSSTNGQMN